ncbi:hypothetical protein KEM52_002896, partial [Ascosphaera acerosa]
PIATTTVTSRSVIATDADLSKITPRSARPRPEPVKIPPPVLTSPEESPASENGPAAAVPAQETNDASARPVGTQPPSQSGPQSQSQPQSQLQTRATADADPPNFKRRSRSGGRRPANPAVRGAGTAGGLVAAKRAELEQRDAAAKSPSLSPDRSGAVSPSFHQVKFRGSRSATPASIARSARRSGAEEVSSDAADVATKTAPSEGARVEVEKEGEQELRLGRDEKAEHTSTTPPSLPTPQAGEANMLAEMEAHLKRESADAGGSQGAPATDWSRDRTESVRLAHEYQRAFDRVYREHEQLRAECDRRLNNAEGPHYDPFDARCNPSKAKRDAYIETAGFRNRFYPEKKFLDQRAAEAEANAARLRALEETKRRREADGDSEGAAQVEDEIYEELEGTARIKQKLVSSNLDFYLALLLSPAVSITPDDAPASELA